jgi:hypothetical protein
MPQRSATCDSPVPAPGRSVRLTEMLCALGGRPSSPPTGHGADDPGPQAVPAYTAIYATRVALVENVA